MRKGIKYYNMYGKPYYGAAAAMHTLYGSKDTEYPPEEREKDLKEFKELISRLGYWSED